MTLLNKTLGVSAKRTFEWTGILQRILREFIGAINVQLSERELDCLYLLPDYLMDLVQADLLEAIEFQVGSDGISIGLSPDPDVEDDLDLSLLSVCDLSGKQLIVHLVLNNATLSQTFGVTPIQQVISRNLVISVKLSELSSRDRSVDDGERRHSKMRRVSQ